MSGTLYRPLSSAGKDSGRKSLNKFLDSIVKYDNIDTNIFQQCKK